MNRFSGFRRPDGAGATRNHVVVAPASAHANRICELVQERRPQTICVSHQSAFERDVLAASTMAGVLANPNCHTAVIVALTGEEPGIEVLRRELGRRGAGAREVLVAEQGSVAATVDRVVEVCDHALTQAAAEQRAAIPIGELVLGTECGGSDAHSGLTANPVVGACADRLVAAGGTVILAEMTELIGAEDTLAARASSGALARRIVEAIARWERLALEFDEDITGTNPCPGNLAGGITTIEEKSLGCVRKSGSSPVVDLVGFGERSQSRGLVVMDTSGDDLEQLVAMTAGGATVIAFTTGRGTPTASPIVPTLKVSSTTTLAERLGAMIDLDAGAVLDGETIEAAGDRLFALVAEVASGRATASELLGQRDFAMPVSMAGV
jgi:altronate dehydratase large subunit